MNFASTTLNVPEPLGSTSSVEGQCYEYKRNILTANMRSNPGSAELVSSALISVTICNPLFCILESKNRRVA